MTPKPQFRFRPLRWGGIIILVIALATMYSKRVITSWHEDSGNIFGTSYHIKYKHTFSLKNFISLELQKVDMTFSIFNPRSLASRLNAGETDSVNSLFCEVFNISKQVFEDTDGAFDPTVRPAVEAWGFGKSQSPQLPPAALDSLRNLIGFQKVSLNGKRLSRADGMTLDFGAVAKGYAVDRVASVLERSGVSDYMIEIGGEVRVLGHNPDARPWVIGIESPYPFGVSLSSQPLPQPLQMTSGAVATSGNYNNTRTIDGKKYSHTINPLTASPQLSDILSATVIAPRCAVADAYATAFMVLGKEKSEKILAHKDSAQLKALLLTN